MSDFIARNKPDWEELQQLVLKAQRWFGQLTPQETSRLDVLYRRTAIHLAQATTQTTDQSLIQFLNGLTARAHTVIYLPPRRSVFSGLMHFMVEGFARSIARQWPMHLASAALLIGGACLVYVTAAHDPLTIYAITPPGDPRLPGSTREQLLEVLRYGREKHGGEKFRFASMLFGHNFRVSVLAMSLGLLAGIPTVFLMAYNGMILGAFISVHHQAGIYDEMWAWILPHGITELSAITLCGGVGLMLGKAVVSPGQRTSSEALRLAGIEAAKTCVGVAGMLAIAAVIESYVRQSHWSTNTRLTFAACTAAFWITYLAYGFVRERRAVREQRAKADFADEAPGND